MSNIKKNIKLYLQIEGNQIIFGDVEEFAKTNQTMTVTTVDDFHEQINNKYVIDEETSTNIDELIDSELGNEDSYPYKFDIKHWVSNRSFGELIDMYDNGEIIKPDMQREFVWDSNKCSRLIESILLGLPIPPLFFLELDNKTYEIIDGFQRLTAIASYVNGKPWNGITVKRSKKSKLSGKINKSLIGKTFEDLTMEQKRIIKRSTIPLIEFKQMDDNDLSSKYLIFERINTGSESLNAMQIRKSLAHGKFINSVYNFANQNESFAALFSPQTRKKDGHVEAFLRVYSMMDIHYNKLETKDGISNILNDYCEKNREKEVDNNFFECFEEALDFMLKVFDGIKNVFRKPGKFSNNLYTYTGNMNICLMEAMMGVYIRHLTGIKIEDIDSIKKRYYEELIKLNIDSGDSNEEKITNPFSVSTGTLESINNRFMICERILGVNSNE